MLILEKEVERDWKRKFVASTAMTSIGFLVLVFSFKKSIILVVLGLAALIVGVRFVRYLMRTRGADESPLLQALKRRPGDIVWVYSYLAQRMPFGLEFSRSLTLYIKLIDRDEFTLSIKEKELAQVMLELKGLLPHATFGHSPDKEQLYIADPRMLLKED